MRRLIRSLVIALSCVLSGPIFAQTIPAYVGSNTCVGCHEDEAALWRGSHHALAWTRPSPETVIADFDGTRFEGTGMIAAFSISDEGTYGIEVTEADGSTARYRVHSVAGIAPLQQYLIETEAGRIQSFDIVWDAEQERWYHLYPDEILPPDDGLHWTGPYKNWNARCAECHATGIDKNYDPRTQTYASTQAEIGVGCEACHGPGEAHLDFVENSRVGRQWSGLDPYGFTMSFDETEATVQQCATCHSRREAHTDQSPIPGTAYHDSYGLAVLRPGLYHADGQIQDEVYVYGSFLQSKMYARGVGCLNCHDAHSAERIADGNAVCTQCHNPAGNPEFPTLVQAEYDSASHHFHDPATEGGQCASCHMIERTYMGIDGRRDHSFRIPRPDVAARTASPDACTDCHTDREAPWAAAALEGWYPDSDHRRSHAGETLARGRVGAVWALDDLSVLASDPDEAGVVRATALWLLQYDATPEIAERLAPLLEDPDPLVRANAVPVQRAAAFQSRLRRVLPILSDPIRSVRIAAAKELVDAPIAQLPSRYEAALSAANRDWQSSLVSRLDFPETHLQLGGIALTRRNMQAATRAFREVVSLDPQRAEAWRMLARITEAVEGRAAAGSVLEEAFQFTDPNDPAYQDVLLPE
ncbi:MAG: multiheme c-type cytochrome [Pseudomonadota bacterium]